MQTGPARPAKQGAKCKPSCCRSARIWHRARGPPSSRSQSSPLLGQGLHQPGGHHHHRLVAGRLQSSVLTAKQQAPSRVYSKRAACMLRSLHARAGQLLILRLTKRRHLHPSHTQKPLPTRPQPLSAQTLRPRQQPAKVEGPRQRVSQLSSSSRPQAVMQPLPTICKLLASQALLLPPQQQSSRSHKPVLWRRTRCCLGTTPLLLSGKPRHGDMSSC